MWTEIRVGRYDAERAVCIVIDRPEVTSVMVNLAPPASGPEAALTVEGASEAELRAALEPHGIFVLAARTVNRPEGAP